jgi:hypothetical protein
MGKRLSIACVVCGLSLLVVLQTAGTLQVGKGYLTKVGPAALRFQTVRAPTLLNLPPLPSEPRDAAVTAVPAAPKESFGLVQSSASAEIPARFFMPSSLWLSQFGGAPPAATPELPETNAATAPDQTDFAPPASDLLIFTPEMLVDYFKPVLAGTNATNVMVLVPMGFTPPFPAAPGSSATYRTP